MILEESSDFGESENNLGKTSWRKRPEEWLVWSLSAETGRGGGGGNVPGIPERRKEWTKLVKGPGHHGGPRRMVEDLSVGGKPR